MSGVGKGVATASIGRILEASGLRVDLLKVDPYLNVDAGTMNPTEHGEVFVLQSGLECDQDMGNYERFLDRDLPPESYITSGMVYKNVIEKERNLKYGGRCVEAIPHIRDEIISRFKKSAKINKSDISVIEIGGTVGDYQNIMFIEAARVLKVLNPDDVLFVLVSYLPIPAGIGEMKTRPTQNAVRQLNSYGVQPDLIIARSEKPLDQKRKIKIAESCNIAPYDVISAPDVKNIYDVPINFEKDKIGDSILGSLKLYPKISTPNLSEWRRFVTKINSLDKTVKIAIIGKYFDTGDFVLGDAYISVIEAIKCGAWHNGRRPLITWLNALNFEKKPAELKGLQAFDGVIIPGGFGERGTAGKMHVIRYVRENKIPFLGLCYGMQLAVVEYARNVAKLKKAHTTEVDRKTPHPVIDILMEQKKNIEHENYGGTMRLGSYPAVIERGTIAYAAYRSGLIKERHRHRFEVNPKYIKKLSAAGLVFSGKSPNGALMEIAELPKDTHPFFVGTQFHPEFHSRPLSPHPLFLEFVKEAIKKSSKN